MFLKRPFAYVPLMFLITAFLVPKPCAAQTPKTESQADASLAEAVKQLQEQVNELRTVVSDLRTESARS